MTRPQKFAGTAAHMRRTDWLLVEWVATAKTGDAFPEPWCRASNPFQTMIGQLVGFGIMNAPHPDADVPTVAEQATAVAKRWIEQHPEPALVPQQLPRHMTYGAHPAMAPPPAGEDGGPARDPARLLQEVRDRLRAAQQARETGDS